MIAHDHRHTSFAAASALALGMIFLAPLSAHAADDAVATAPPVVADSTLSQPASLPPNVDVSLSCDGRYTIVSTKTETVAAFLAARGIHVTETDFVSVPLDSQLIDRMNITFRSSKIITILDGAKKRTLRSSASTIAAVIANAGIAVGKHDVVVPGLHEQPLPSDVIRIDRSSAWTVHSRTDIAQSLRSRSTEHLAPGTSRTIDPGRPGVRETTTRIVRAAGGRVVRTVLASRIIRAPRARVVEHGIAAYASLATAAEHGFSSAFHFAGAAIHMIATAYTASCYGCSGITASGQHAGLGIIAVDPSVIPLGTKLFIPGYGRAIAGDTGGAIRGHRVDLGMNTVADALRFGRRPITVYVLR